MSKRTQTHESPYSSPDYHYPATKQRSSESVFSKFMDKAHELRERARDKKVGRKAVAGAVLVGAAIGGGMEIAQATEASHKQEIAEMNEKFEPKLKPAAENIVDFALDQLERSKAESWDYNRGYGGIRQDPSDPGKFDVSFHGKTENGRYDVTAVVGKGRDGKLDISKVTSAELVEISEDEAGNEQLGKVTDVAVDDPIFDKGYWGASVAFTSPVQEGSYNTYNYEQYDNLEDDVARAGEIATDVNTSIEDLRAEK
jgi:hypothetical protein